MKKLFTLSIIAICLACLAGCQHVDDPGVDKKNSMVVYGDYSYIDPLTYTGTDEQMQATIAYAYSLYASANYLDQHCTQRKAYSFCEVTTTGQKAYNCVYELKNREEFLKFDYRPSLTLVPGYGQVTYANIKWPSAYYVEVGDSTISAEGVGHADFGQTTGVMVDLPFFHPSQEQGYEAAGAVILPQTVTEASVQHNDEEGFYTVRFLLDASNPITARNLVGKLRSSSSLTRNANYTFFEETFEIWDNGFFKSFRSLDKWKAGAIKSTIDYQTTFSYTDEDCDLSQYNDNYCAIIKELCRQANNSIESEQ